MFRLYKQLTGWMFLHVFIRCDQDPVRNQTDVIFEWLMVKSKHFLVNEGSVSSRQLLGGLYHWSPSLRLFYITVVFYVEQIGSKHLLADTSSACCSVWPLWPQCESINILRLLPFNMYEEDEYGTKCMCV